MQTSTYTTLIKSADISPETESSLSAYAALFGRVERKLYASLCADKMTANERKSHFIRKHQISGRQYNAILRTLTGKLDSKRELDKLYQSEKKERIEAVSGTISRLQSQADMLSKTGGVPPEIQKIRFKAHQKSRYRARLTEQLEKIASNTGKIPSMCFGSKKLFGKQFFLKENNLKNHAEWLEEWQNARSSQFMVLGSKDETCGNQGAQLYVDNEDEFRLSLRLPDALGGGRAELSGFDFNYGKSAVLAACAENERRRAANVKELTRSSPWVKDRKTGEIRPQTKNEVLSSYGQPLTMRFIRHKFGWTLAVTVEEQAPEVTTGSYENGCLGIDVNADHLAVCVVTPDGNKRYVENVPCPASGRGLTTGQRMAMIGDAVKRIIEIGKTYGVGVGIEKLDFSRKKQALKETANKHHRTMLSAFAHNMVLSLIERRCYREGLPCKAVNPTMTSIIGMFKYHSTQNTTHQAAAQVIARRTLGLKHDRIRFSVPHRVGTQLCSARSKTVSIDGGPLQRWGKVKAIVKKHAALLKQPEKTGPPVPLMVNGHKLQCVLLA